MSYSFGFNPFSSFQVYLLTWNILPLVFWTFSRKSFFLLAICILKKEGGGVIWYVNSFGDNGI